MKKETRLRKMPLLLPPGAKMEIAKTLKCGRATVWRALVCNKPGPMADRVRAYVLEKYGYEDKD